jgi:NAD+--asparagine ADP-ribosyltransferase
MAVEKDSFTSTNKNRMYREQIITLEDLNEFRSLLLSDLNEIVNAKEKQQKQWLKSSEVRKLLNISPGTLQNFRINGILSYNKIGGTMYYAYNDLEKIMECNKVNALPTLFK